MGDVTKSAAKAGSNLQDKRFSLAVAHANELEAVRAEREKLREQAKKQNKREMREYIKKHQISEANGVGASASGGAGATETIAETVSTTQTDAKQSEATAQTENYQVVRSESNILSQGSEDSNVQGQNYQNKVGHGSNVSSSSESFAGQGTIGHGHGHGHAPKYAQSADKIIAKPVKSATIGASEVSVVISDKSGQQQQQSAGSKYKHAKEWYQQQHDPQTAQILKRQMSMDSNAESQDDSKQQQQTTGGKIAGLFGIGKNKSSKPKKKKKVTYTVNNEKYTLYSYYKPVRQIGDGAYATVMLSIFVFLY